MFFVLDSTGALLMFDLLRDEQRPVQVHKKIVSLNDFYVFTAPLKYIVMLLLD